MCNWVGFRAKLRAKKDKSAFNNTANRGTEASINLCKMEYIGYDNTKECAEIESMMIVFKE